MTFKQLSLDQILEKLPHKRVVRFALDCAYDVKDHTKDPRSIKALKITELWLIDKATAEEVKIAAYDVVSASANASASAAAYFAAHTAFAISASNAAYFAACTASASNAAYAADYAAIHAARITNKDYRQVLLDSLSDLETLLWHS